MNPRYYDEFKVGEKFVTGARTVTEADVVNFCGLAGIFDPLFVDEEYAKNNTIFGKRIVPGPLIFVLSVGMWMRLGLFEQTVIALLEVNEMRVLAPVFHGDTLHAEAEVIMTRKTSKPDRGILQTRHTTFNQKNEKVLDVIMTYMLKSKPTGNKNFYVNS